MSALAIALKERGYRITGSDKGFYPPVSSNLTHAGIDFYPGWHPEKMIAGSVPDLVVVGNVASSRNPEWLYIQKNNIPHKSYPEVVREFIIKKNSIVCAGTFGKSTNATLMAWILLQAGYNPSYMFGGVAVNDLLPARITNGDWSVVEGDEYKTSRSDDRAKFFHYAPTHLFLTAAVWDHADVYPTEETYQAAFRELIDIIPKNGFIVSNSDEKTARALLQHTTKPQATFGSTPLADYQFSNIVLTKNGTSWTIMHTRTNEFWHVRSCMLGDYIAKNFTGCFALSHYIGIAPEKIVTAIETFKGVKRRLEKRSTGDVAIYDDISHSPQKSEAVLRSLREIYSGDIYAVYEPNTGNRKRESREGYAHAFKDAACVLIPRLTKVKTDPNDPYPPMDGRELALLVGETHNNAVYMDNDDALVDYLATHAKKDDCIVFLGSHGFRGMIEGLIRRVTQSNAE